MQKKCGDSIVSYKSAKKGNAVLNESNLYFLNLVIETANISVRFLRSFLQLHHSNHWIGIIGEHTHNSMNLLKLEKLKPSLEEAMVIIEAE